jgi:acyl-homoserine lactone acylase PvdQ
MGNCSDFILALFFTVLITIGFAGFMLRSTPYPDDFSVTCIKDVGTFHVHYDHNTGIPTISADNEITTICGLGYMHSMDRTHEINQDFLHNFGMMAELFGPKYVTLDKLIMRMRNTDFGGPIHGALNDYEKNFLNAYVFGLQTAKDTMVTNPLLFWLSNHGTQNPYLNHVQYEYLLMHFYTHCDDWIKEVLREHLKEGEVDNETIDFLLSGQLLKEVDQFSKPITGLEYYDAVENTEIFKRHIQGNSWAFAVSGKHTTTGRPYLANSIEGLNRMPSKFYIAKL